MLSGIFCHNLGPLKLMVSVPYIVVFTRFVPNFLAHLNGQQIFLLGKMVFIIFGLRLFSTRYISVSNTFMFFSCMVTDKSLCNNSLNVELLSLYTKRSARSWILFMRAFSVLLSKLLRNSRSNSRPRVTPPVLAPVTFSHIYQI